VALPLDGVRVLDLGVALAGPSGAAYLADLGAEVIRIESTQHFPPMTRGPMARPSPELVRRLPPVSGGYPNRDPGVRPWNRHPWFNLTARNKLSMTVDLEQPAGLELFKRLVAMSDVLVTNQAPGKLGKLGLAWEDLRAVNPQLIYVEATSFGSAGPYKDYRAMGHQMEAFSAHDSLRHRRGGDSKDNSWVVAADAAGSAGIALASLMALHERVESGIGQYIDIAMVEAFVGLLGHHILDFTVNGHVPSSMGNRDYSALQGCYRCLGDDRWLVVTVCSDEQWAALCGALGHDEYADNVLFDTAPSRHENHDAADGLLSSWFAEHDRDEAVGLLRSIGVPAGPVLDDADAYVDEHLEARGYFLEISQRDTGTYRYPGFPYRFTENLLTVRHPPCMLGEHNEYVYKDLLGVTDEEYAQLERDGHIGDEYAPHIQ